MSGSPPKSTGAALVVGGGVAGIQCSLDLAEGGYKVYLVETAPALGGYMAQLDKTFPTTDCSMCTLAPKLVEAGRHLNIEIVTNSELIGLEGEPGSFDAKIYHHARFVRARDATHPPRACPRVRGPPSPLHRSQHTAPRRSRNGDARGSDDCDHAVAFVFQPGSGRARVAKSRRCGIA